MHVHVHRYTQRHYYLWQIKESTTSTLHEQSLFHKHHDIETENIMHYDYCIIIVTIIFIISINILFSHENIYKS